MNYFNLSFLLSTFLVAARAAENIKWIDVKSSGKDDAQRLVNALKSNTHVRLQRGRTLKIASAMNTTSLRDVHFKLEGTLQVEPNLSYWAGNAFPIPYQKNSAVWLFGGENVVLDGGGTIDGKDLNIISKLFTMYQR
ncbi:hypothetical protein FRC12_020708 [Ceratobasidium sp. 428]|nr:hypothetical protein FRC12_020708 [Ceratobasidium sp. 428]